MPSTLPPPKLELRAPPGADPFRARGIVYLATLKYVDMKLSGGRAALRAALGQGGSTDFVDQIFLAGSLYDIGPLIETHGACARLEGIPLRDFVVARSRESAETDIRGIYRVMLRLSSSTKVAERLPRAFSRYFVPCRATARDVQSGLIDARFSCLPRPTAQWYLYAVEGFVSRALELAGARDVSFSWKPPEPDAPMGSIETVALDAVIRWR